jgi:magnesium transporter
MDVQRPTEEDIDEIELLTQPGREDDLRTFLLLLHPADVAELVSEIKEPAARAVLRFLEPTQAAQLLSELEPSEQRRVIDLLGVDRASEVVANMETDDATDLLQDLEDGEAKVLLTRLPASEQRALRKLLKYEPDTAGGIMQTELVYVSAGSTAKKALDAIRNASPDIDIISVFVVDDVHRYAGNVPLKKLVLAQEPALVEEIMEPKIVEVTPEVDQEEVARIFDHYSLVELAVVDSDGQLIGRITADDVHEVLIEEAEEDMLKMAGTGADPEVIDSDRLSRVVMLRLPWLLSTFIAGLLASYILQSAHLMFSTAVVLLAFVPVITGMSGNVGTQSAMLMIRGMTLGNITSESLLRTVSRDAAVAAIMAVICGGAAASIIGLWQHDWALGACVGVALAFSMVIAGILGSIEPPILSRMGIDPAVAAGPLITSINDISGALIYTLVASLFLQYLK